MLPVCHVHKISAFSVIAPQANVVNNMEAKSEQDTLYVCTKFLINKNQNNEF